MKETLELGDSKSLEVTVEKEMFSRFGEELVHSAYSTASMVYHMEWVSRDLLLPYLDEEEESAGVAVSIKHIAPSAEGTRICIKAAVIEISRDKVKTEVTASNEQGLIGKGEVVQAIMPRHTMQRKLDKQTIEII